MRRILLCTLLISAAAPAFARSLQVPRDYPSIQFAIAAAAAGDTILLACRTFVTSNITLRSDLTLRGDPAAVECVVIDGLNHGRVIDCVGVQNVVLENLTVRGGLQTDGWLAGMGAAVRCSSATVRISNCRFSNNQACIGGAVGVIDSEIVIEDCEFTANAAVHAAWAGGGGVWCRNSLGTVRNCVFDGNTAFSTDRPGDGGGLFVERSHLQVLGCTFAQNSAGGGGGGLYSFSLDESAVQDCAFEHNSAQWGGGVFLELSRATLLNCTLRENSAHSGGGISITGYSTSVLEGCLFLQNQATQFDGGGLEGWESDLTLHGCTFRRNAAVFAGGAVKLGGTNAVVTGCVFQENIAPRGGALRCQFSTPHLSNCTLSGNRASIEGGGISATDAAGAVLANCIVAFSAQGESVVGRATSGFSLSCCDVYGNAGGDWVPAIADQFGATGNISADPLFCNPIAGDLQINLDSPCAPFNSAGCGLIGTYGIACPLTAAPPPDAALALAPAWPNPFNPSTTIRFTTGIAGAVRVVIMDVAGRHVRTLADEVRPAGDYTLQWDGRDEGGRAVAAGIYHCVVESGGRRVTAKLALIR